MCNTLHRPRLVQRKPLNDSVHTESASRSCSFIRGIIPSGTAWTSKKRDIAFVVPEELVTQVLVVAFTVSSLHLSPFYYGYFHCSWDCVLNRVRINRKRLVKEQRRREETKTGICLIKKTLLDQKGLFSTVLLRMIMMNWSKPWFPRPDVHSVLTH